MVDKCLAKNPDEPIPDDQGFVVDLRAVRRELESGLKASVASSTKPPMITVAVGPQLAIMLLIVAW